jgi:NAD(P)-dependent dehydrogenase (short-subunit alcohol dehydrogenase family)
VGISIQGELLDVTEADWDKVFNTNLKGAMLSNQAALKHMVERGAPGSITNVSSTASKRWTPMQFLSYTTSKAALNQMTRINARQYAPQKVRFNLILPGLIDTPHSEALYRTPEEARRSKEIRSGRCPLGRQGLVWEVAEAAVFLNSDEASYITGLEMVVDGGLTL